ncbi:winged helix-turn-helix domain-containing protein [Candidatus Nitrososphaera gargensis]|uniref:winged helix-turn-helix domain-containing protein n=1 Tax=Candidatus Nitrososphaera gargensis TaxID=497727 RepID=UPI001E5894E2|nr:winged helix-turn-helix domain-containing protein [Candidatus Nitrososphaera gargensis]
MEDRSSTTTTDLGTLARTISSRAVAQILDFFLDHKEFDYSPAEIAKKTGLSFRTIFRELPMLEKYQLIYNSRKIGKTNMYRLNTDFRAVSLLEQFTLEMAQVKVDHHNDSKGKTEINTNIIEE